MPKPAVRMTVALCVTAVLAVACSDSTGPSNGPDAASYVALISVSGDSTLGGVVTLDAPAGASTAMRNETGPRFELASLIVRPLYAQSTVTATGTLVNDRGEVIPLSGTYANRVFSLTGGGYSITASIAANGSVSDSGTAPGGLTAGVTAAAPATSPGSSISKGRYVGSFTISTFMTNKQKNSAGVQTGACMIRFVITGTVTIDIEEVAGSRVSTHMDMNRTESSVAGQGTPGAPVCQFAQNYSSGVMGFDYDGPASSLHLIRIHSGRDGAATISRTQGFVGGVSGNSIVGTVLVGYSGIVPITNGTHYESYPTGKTTVTLTKQ